MEKFTLSRPEMSNPLCSFHSEFYFVYYIIIIIIICFHVNVSPLSMYSAAIYNRRL